jgi:hypothetical protein
VKPESIAVKETVLDKKRGRRSQSQKAQHSSKKRLHSGEVEKRSSSKKCKGGRKKEVRISDEGDSSLSQRACTEEEASKDNIIRVDVS